VLHRGNDISTEKCNSIMNAHTVAIKQHMADSDTHKNTVICWVINDWLKLAILMAVK
jgi:hypothetical protein